MKLAESLRDEIWGAAVKAYQNGEKWWLTGEQERMNDKVLTSHVTLHPYQEEIEDFLEDLEQRGEKRFSFESLKNEVDPGNNSPKFTRIVKAMLEDLGWEGVRFRTNSGKLVRGYAKKKTSDSESNPLQDADTAFNASNDDSSSDLCYNTDQGAVKGASPSQGKGFSDCDTKNEFSNSFKKNGKKEDSDEDKNSKSLNSTSRCHKELKPSQERGDSLSNQPEKEVDTPSQPSSPAIKLTRLVKGAKVLIDGETEGVILGKASGRSKLYYVETRREDGKKNLVSCRADQLDLVDGSKD